MAGTSHLPSCPTASNFKTRALAHPPTASSHHYSSRFIAPAPTTHPNQRPTSFLASLCKAHTALISRTPSPSPKVMSPGLRHQHSPQWAPDSEPRMNPPHQVLPPHSMAFSSSCHTSHCRPASRLSPAAPPGSATDQHLTLRLLQWPPASRSLFLPHPARMFQNHLPSFFLWLLTAHQPSYAHPS